MNSTQSGARRNERSKSRVQSVERACRLLQILTESASQEHTVLDLARAADIDRTVAYRVLRTLVDNGLAAERHGKYAIGPRAATLSLAYVEQTRLRQVALPYAVDLDAGLGDTPWIVSLAIPALDCAILVERLWKANAPLSTLLDLGTRLSLEGTAIGRCFLAYGAAVLPDAAACTPELKARLEDIRAADGIEYSSNEVRVGISALASIIRTSSGSPIGAICVSGADLEPQLSRDSDVAKKLSRTVQAISRVLR